MISDWARVGLVTPHELQGYGVSVRISREINAYQKLLIPVTVFSAVEDGFVGGCEIARIGGILGRLAKFVDFNRIANSEAIIRKVFSLRRLNKFIKQLGSKTAKIAEEREINILHSDDFVGSIISLSAKDRMKKEPIIVGEFADLIHLDFKERFKLKDTDELVVGTKELLCEALDKIDFAFFVSPIDREIAIRELGIHPNKTLLLYEAADKNAPYMSSYRQAPNNICYLGVLASWENPALLIAGYENAAHHMRNLVCTIIGAGPLFARTQKLVNKTHGISFYGWRPYAEALKIASTTDIGIITTTKARAMPSKLFVYASLGLPVVSIEGMWWSEHFVKQYGVGYLASPNPESMGNAIQQALQNPEELEYKGRQARILIENEYNWGSRTTKMLKVYENLAGH
jgi:glycosyltransferase involved in cell wall biosynthesis